MTRVRRITLFTLLAAAIVAAVLLAVWCRPATGSGPVEPPAHVVAAEQFLRRHAANVFAGEGGAACDFAIDAVAAAPARKHYLRTFVRRSPFGFRREERDTPAGQPVVHVSDGRHAWRARSDDPAGRGELLRGEEARLVLEAAWIDGLRYFDVPGLAQRLMLGPTMSLPVLPGTPRELVPPAPVQPMVTYLPSGLELRLYFDPADGRLLGLANPTIVPQRNVRFGDHRQFGPLRLPATRLENRGAGACTRIEVQAVRREVLPAELFAGNPLAAATGVVVAGPLERVATAIPGTCYFMVPAVQANSRPAGAALFDTGAGRTYLTPRLADALGLPVLSPRGAGGVAGHARGTRRWLDTVELPGFSFAQLEVTAMELPFTAQLGDGRLPEIVLGNELLAASPVLDLRRVRLLLRGAPVEPLDGAGVFVVPLSRRRYADLDVLPIEVGGRRLHVALDTGMPFALRLTGHGLLRAGLPADAAAWRARGAVVMGVGGAGQRATEALLVRIDEVAIGPVVLERPWAMLVFDASLGDEDEGALGAGALMGFARVGIDRVRRVLELEPGAGAGAGGGRGGGGGGLRVPAPGVFLGMSVVVPDADAQARGERLPVVREVIVGTPAAAAGVVVGDRVVAIDGVGCEGMAAGVVNERLWGSGGRAVLVVEVRRADGSVERVEVRSGE